MKYLFSALLLIILLVTACSPSANLGRPNYTIVSDTETKVLRGVLSRSLIENDTSFKWFKENMQYGTADASAVAAFKQKAGQFSILIFGGTWCHDTQNLLPKFYRLADKSGLPETNISFVGLDRKKTTVLHLQIKWKIVSVPTFIVVNKKGYEVGRVVEYGKSGNMEKELGEIVGKM
jgi:thiol-disulfide isomerase/thioredoxin